MKRPIVRGAVSILFLSVVAALLALGTWQVERRAWKHALIARVEAGLKAPPIAAPATAGPEDAYRRVTATGRFLRAKDSFVQASTIRGPGWWVLTPLRIDDGRTILINRGYVPTRLAAAPPCPHPNRHPGFVPGSTVPQTKAPGSVPPGGPRNKSGVTTGIAKAMCTITGLLRLTEPGGGFLRSNDPAADRWYSRDVAAIAARRGIAAAPYFIDADAGLNRPGQPIGGLTVIRFADNHLVYAVTWYILALMTLAGFLYWRRTA